MILLLDNYDSFAFNLVRFLEELGETVYVRRSDAVSVEELDASPPSHIVISPGPGTPAEAGVSVDVIRALGDRVPILGVCLGHQCLAQAFGGRITRAARPMHGRLDRLEHRKTGLFAGLPTPLQVTRYHSLVVEPDAPGDGLVVTASSGLGEVMALRHERHPLWGVQFHPEAVMTFGGHRLLANFLAMGRGSDPAAVEVAAVPCADLP